MDCVSALLNNGSATIVLPPSSSPLCSSSPQLILSSPVSPATIYRSENDSVEELVSNNATDVQSTAASLAVTSPRCLSPATSFNRVQERLKQQLRDQPISPSRGTSLGFRALIMANRKRMRNVETHLSTMPIDSNFTLHSRLDRVSIENLFDVEGDVLCPVDKSSVPKSNNESQLNL